MVDFGKMTATTIIRMMEELENEEKFGRKKDGVLVDEGWYIARNLIEIMGDIGPSVHSGIPEAFCLITILLDKGF